MADSDPDQLQKITMNLAPVVRHETLHGREYLVAPMVMLTVGVHKGSNGPLYYSEQELSKTPQVWNMKPVVVYHPMLNGQGVTATDPDVLAVQSVGMVMGARFDVSSKKLRAEAWLEKDRLDAVDSRIVDTLESGTPMEVSTGLYTDNQYNPGTHEGKDYEMVARNHRPDHLAILPDKVGACSVADGAGLLQLNMATEIPESLGVPAARTLRNRLNRYITVQKHNGSSVMSLEEMADVLISNESTAWGEDDRGFLEEQSVETLEKFIPVENKKPPYKFGDKRLPDEIDEDEEEEKRGMKKAPLKNDADVEVTAAPLEAQPSKSVTVEEYIAAAPEEIRDMLSVGLASHNAEKEGLISDITSNAANTFTNEQLGGKDLFELQQLHKFAAVAAPVTNPPLYGGQAAPTGNAAVTQEQGLSIPVMTFDD